MHTHRLTIPHLGEVRVIGNSDWIGEVTISWGDASNSVELRLPDGLLPGPCSPRRGREDPAEG